MDPRYTTIGIATGSGLGDRALWAIRRGASTREAYAVGVAYGLDIIADAVRIGIVAIAIFINVAVTIIVDSVATNFRHGVTLDLAVPWIIDGDPSRIGFTGIVIILPITSTDRSPQERRTT